MAASDKLAKLNKYVADLKSKLADPTPAKHASHPQTYKQFLTREIEMHQKKIDDLKLSEPAKK